MRCLCPSSTAASKSSRRSDDGATAVAPSSGLLEVKKKLANMWGRSRAWSEIAKTPPTTRPDPAEVIDRIKEVMKIHTFNYIVILRMASALALTTFSLAFLGSMVIPHAFCCPLFRRRVRRSTKT